MTAETVTPEAIRDAVEWLAMHANGVSLLDWEPRSQTLLSAASEIERLHDCADYWRGQANAARNAAAHETAAWHSIETAPLDKFILLWWVGNNANEAAHMPTIGQVSSHEPGKWWTSRGTYDDLAWVTHWMPLPARPSEKAREPLPPDVLASALQDRVHEDRGATRAGRSVKTSADVPQHAAAGLATGGADQPAPDESICEHGIPRRFCTALHADPRPAVLCARLGCQLAPGHYGPHQYAESENEVTK